MELRKLREQILDHIKALGVVNLGFLIKAETAKGKRVPTCFDHSVPLAGFDIYCSDETMTS